MKANNLVQDQLLTDNYSTTKADRNDLTLIINSHTFLAPAAAQWNRNSVSTSHRPVDRCHQMTRHGNIISSLR